MTTQRRVLLMTLLCAALTAANAAEETLTPAAYRAQLEKVRAAGAAGKTEEAAQLSTQLMNARVNYGGETLPTDRSVLETIAQKNPGRSQARLSQLIDELDRMDGAPKSSGTSELAADSELLAKIRATEEYDGPKKSGDLDKINAKLNRTFIDDITDFFKSILSWIGRQLQSFFNWLANLFRGGSMPEGDPESLLPFMIMFGLICLGITALVLLTVWRQNRAREGAALTPGNKVTATARDADPLSRNANEWEVYAAELARQGNFREAIRAWYHAVLVTLYRGGVLHYRKGATNWEYCSMLSPRFGWRPSFVELTRQFEREWYGQKSSSAQACDDYSGLARDVLASARKVGEA